MGTLMGTLFGILIFNVKNFCKPEWQDNVYIILGITFFCYLVDVCIRPRE